MTLDVTIALVGSTSTGYRGIDVRYRIDRGQRRRFRATLSDGQSLRDLLSVALVVIDRDARLDAGRGGEQLRLDAAGAFA